MKKKNKAIYLLFLMPFVYFATACFVMWLVKTSGIYPSGSDTMYPVYRGDYVYNAIKSGNWYPLYDPAWYNGVEILRYWSPFPAYVMAFCQYLAGGSQFGAYLFYIGGVCFLGACVWPFIGRGFNRPYLGAFIGLIWFFMPNNLCALFVEGNLARSLSMIFLPVFIYAVYKYFDSRKTRYLLLITLSLLLIAMCHAGYAVMVVAVAIIYGIIYCIQNKRIIVLSDAIISMVLSFVIYGIWLIGVFRIGKSSLYNTENVMNFFQSIWKSVNPLQRLLDNNASFYFGFAVMFIAIFGIVFGYKKSRTGFITGLVILILTTNASYIVLRYLPGSQYMWMLRFISIAICMILISFLVWDTLKKPLVILLCVLLVADVIPSVSLITGSHNYASPQDRFASKQNETLIAEAQNVTKQRLAVLDESTLESTGAWLVSDYNKPVSSSYGAGREAADTIDNIVNINNALANGRFRYVFDRCLELGNDSVLVKLSLLEQYNEDLQDFENAANAVGYKCIEKNSDYILYHIETPDNWGVVSSYRAVAIGSGAAAISMQFPAVETADSPNLNDYTYEELAGYKEVFLNGFTYDDKEIAEDLVLRLSRAGVKVIIYSDGIPQDKRTHSQNFLGVTCSSITFHNGYPDMDTRIGTIYPDMFPQGHTTWNTVYLDGLDTVWGTFYDNGLNLDFYGTVKNDNIIMTGLNLTYFYSLTDDVSVGQLLSNMSGISSEELPDRKIVPLKVEYGNNEITITSNNDNVNTTLAYHDIFNSSSDITHRNNLMYVNKGTTVVKMSYPYLWQGALVSTAGVVLMVVWLIVKRRKEHNI